MAKYYVSTKIKKCQLKGWENMSRGNDYFSLY